MINVFPQRKKPAWLNTHVRSVSRSVQQFSALGSRVGWTPAFKGQMSERTASVSKQPCGIVFHCSDCWYW